MYHQIGMWDQKWVIGNWKMNGRLQNNNALMHRFRVMPTAERVLIGLAAPTVYLLQLHNAMQIVHHNRILTCAQDVSRSPTTAPTQAKFPQKCLPTSAQTSSSSDTPNEASISAKKNEIQRPQMENVLNVGSFPYCASAKA